MIHPSAGECSRRWKVVCGQKLVCQAGQQTSCWVWELWKDRFCSVTWYDLKLFWIWIGRKIWLNYVNYLCSRAYALSVSKAVSALGGSPGYSSLAVAVKTFPLTCLSQSVNSTVWPSNVIPRHNMTVHTNSVWNSFFCSFLLNFIICCYWELEAWEQEEHGFILPL